ncbi:MAG: hypothetical protein JETCAE01_31690 [Anaerolineaceae bacterium]|nr:MAG: hypothetical protein JETCAE01_31690 [Anaerolineaceae bacterium]
MELPNKSKAQVPFEKIVDYLLSETHSVGRSKAKYFRSYGFDEENAGLLAEGLLSIAQDSPIESSEQSSFGVKYILVGDIETPNGDIIQIRTVWIIEGNLDFPRFVTAYPVE